MEKQILKVAAIQCGAIAGFLALLPATDYFGLNLIQGAMMPSGSVLAGMVVYMVLLAYGGRWILGDRFFVDPIRPAPVENNSNVPAYARYLSQFGAPFLPGTRGTVQMNAHDNGQELNALANRFEGAMTRKLRRLQKMEEEQRPDSTDPLLV